MAYAHAERNLATLLRLEAETRQLLASLDQTDREQSALLREHASIGAPDHEMDVAGRSGMPITGRRTNMTAAHHIECGDSDAR